MDECDKRRFRLDLNLKGDCLDILLSLQKGRKSSYQSTRRNNGLVLLPKTMLLHLNCLLVTVVETVESLMNVVFDKHII